MKVQYSPQDIARAIAGLSKDLQEALFGSETAERIYSIAEKYSLQDTSSLATLVGLSLIGLLHPDDLRDAIQKDLKLSKETSKKIDLEIRRFIFSPVREELSKMYQYEFTPLAKPDETLGTKRVQEKTGRAPAPQQKRAPGEDIYREPLE